MDRITGTYLIRGIELLLVALWRAYGGCNCASDFWLSFAKQTELHQIGTLTVVAIITRTCVVTLREVSLGAGILVANGWKALRRRCHPTDPAA